MSEQQKSEDGQEPIQRDRDSTELVSGGEQSADQQRVPAVEEQSTNQPGAPVGEQSTNQQPGAPVGKSTPTDVEWIPGEHLELLKIPAPTIWPATIALGATGIAFGVVTHWILSIAGLFLFLLGAAGWIEDMRNDVLQ